jgi:hypothetical protein
VRRAEIDEGGRQGLWTAEREEIKKRMLGKAITTIDSGTTPLLLADAIRS